MRMPLKFGIPLLIVLWAGSRYVPQTYELVLIMLAMGVALWTAFSLPRPGPKPQDTTVGGVELPRPDDEEAEK